MKLKTMHRCQSCGFASPKWLGQCPDCKGWNTLVEEVTETGKPGAKERRALTDFSSELTPLDKARAADEPRIKTGISEVDRLLGGGLVRGQAALLAGAPGIGKSTLTLQLAGGLAPAMKVLYVSGEESLHQVGARAARLKVNSKDILLLSETDLSRIIEAYRKVKPGALVIDSIQTVYHPQFAGSPGTVSQVRESAAELLRLCKSDNALLVLLGHVTKEGSLAGPRVLEHIVDTVLYFDSERHNLLRILRAYKNRFGPTSEIGIFSMSESGLGAVEDASLHFSSAGRDKPLKGRAFSVAMEGSRPIAAEVQALVAPTRYPFPRRLASGLDLNRCQLLLAALERHVGLSLENKDVFLSVAGGIRLDDPALDLAVCAAVISSARDTVIGWENVFVGEVGILGQVSRVPWLGARLAEAGRLGFKTAHVPPVSGSEKLPQKPSAAVTEDLRELFNAVAAKAAVKA
ncbi:MAG: DNA repair protein RadA [Elusimicrobiales bacterium]